MIVSAGSYVRRDVLSFFIDEKNGKETFPLLCIQFFKQQVDLLYVFGCGREILSLFFVIRLIASDSSADIFDPYVWVTRSTR